MKTEHPITPPPELVQEWVTDFAPKGMMTIATIAARWGADQELEACCEWMADETPTNYINALRAARRPNPQALREQALDELQFSFSRGYLKKEAVDIIRRALESLPD